MLRCTALTTYGRSHCPARATNAQLISCSPALVAREREVLPLRPGVSKRAIITPPKTASAPPVAMLPMLDRDSSLRASCSSAQAKRRAFASEVDTYGSAAGPSIRLMWSLSLMAGVSP